MTKTETLQTLAESTGKSKKEVSEMLEAIVALAYTETKKSGEFTLPGLGKLLKKKRKKSKRIKNACAKTSKRCRKRPKRKR